MNYKKYKNARNLSWNILLNENINSLPVDIIRLCKQMKIKVKYYTPNDKSDGKCTIIDGVPYIFVNKDCSNQRKRFTVAHELGHILLGHVGKYKLVNREPSRNDNPIEKEANVFASRILAPACVLWGCNVKTASDISKLCDISKKSAKYRMKRMKELYKRNKFLTSPLEKQVYNAFKEFIINHQHREDF